MKPRRRIAVVTSTRADYGLLRWPMRAIAASSALELQLIVTGTHLAPGFGMTVHEIERDGFAIDARIEILLDSDSAVGTSHTMSLALAGMAGALERLAPDLVLVLGDRYEILAVAAATLIARRPLCHIAGGDVTEGAYDDAMRHAISKMAHLHFPTNAESARLLLQMGEAPHSVHCVGNPALDAINQVEYLERKAFFARVGLTPRARNILFTYHPVTLGDEAGETEIARVLSALEALGPEVGMLVTGSNADTGHGAVRSAIEAFVQRNANVRFVESLGQMLYFNALRQVDAVVGNSSSGLLEAPSFHVPTVNIGPRQDGRLRAASVIDCAPQVDDIARAIATALATDCSAVVNPYGDGHTSARIVSVLENLDDPAALLRKKFHRVVSANAGEP